MTDTDARGGLGKALPDRARDHARCPGCAGLQPDPGTRHVDAHALHLRRWPPITPLHFQAALDG